MVKTFKLFKNINYNSAKLMSVLAGSITWGMVSIVNAGDIEPPIDAVNMLGSPAPTMRSLGDIPPAWNKEYNTNPRAGQTRFEPVFDLTGAVYDRNTGLVWWKYDAGNASWKDAWNLCYTSKRGGVAGWRLPRLEELLSIFTVNSTSGALVMTPNIAVAPGYSLWSATPSKYVRTVFEADFGSFDFQDSAPVVSYAYGVRALSVDGNEYDVAELDVDNTSGRVLNHFICVRGGAGGNRPPVYYKSSSDSIRYE